MMIVSVDLRIVKVLPWFVYHCKSVRSMTLQLQFYVKSMLPLLFTAFYCINSRQSSVTAYLHLDEDLLNKKPTRKIQ